MAGPGHEASLALPDGRVVEYWEGGDPAGHAMIMHPGTPESRLMGKWGHEAALSAGVRLVSVSRPGYGGSTMTTGAASLLATGRDTASLASQLGVDEYAVFGLSGGGPFAVATAVADPGYVRALGVVGGLGPWRLLDDPSKDPEGSKCLDLLDAGDVAGAWDCMRRDAEQWSGGLVALDDAARVDAIMADVGDDSSLVHDAGYRAIWADNMRVVLDNTEGYVFDNLAWGGTWDVDPRDVATPTLLWYGERDTHTPPAHGQWYADRIADSELIILPGAVHLDVVDSHWPEVLAGLLRVWK
jgi:pimeloyl-ACP methyl ester carboxylesterase